ncbi:MAG: hypothetical protein JWP12_548 [Bacteroidetes bacterium]|nr:hypothetical protein [Bacteroidota bacterium]
MISDSNPSANKLRYYVNFIMVAVYLALGLLFLFTDIAEETFPANRKAVGTVLLVYGCFRMIITIQKLKRRDQDQ